VSGYAGLRMGDGGEEVRMELIVCVKQVPAEGRGAIDPVTGALKRESAPAVINPEDLCAIEEGLLLKERNGARVTVLSMGPPQAEKALREALAMGVDKAVLLCDRSFAGADTLVTSYVLARAIRRLGQYDLVLCGRRSADGNTAQVGPELAERLGVPQVTAVRGLTVRGDRLLAERALELGSQWVEAKLPAVVTVSRRVNTPRQASVEDILLACREKEVAVWGAEELGIDGSSRSFLRPATRLESAMLPERKERRGELLSGSPDELARALLDRFEQRQLVR